MVIPRQKEALKIRCIVPETNFNASHKKLRVLTLLGPVFFFAFYVRGGGGRFDRSTLASNNF